MLKLFEVFPWANHSLQSFFGGVGGYPIPQLGKSSTKHAIYRLFPRFSRCTSEFPLINPGIPKTLVLWSLPFKTILLLDLSKQNIYQTPWAFHPFHSTEIRLRPRATSSAQRWWWWTSRPGSSNGGRPAEKPSRNGLLTFDSDVWTSWHLVF